MSDYLSNPLHHMTKDDSSNLHRRVQKMLEEEQEEFCPMRNREKVFELTAKEVRKVLLQAFVDKYPEHAAEIMTSPPECLTTDTPDEGENMAGTQGEPNCFSTANRREL